MRIYPSPLLVMEIKAPLRVGTGMPRRERFRICEVPHSAALLSHRGLAHAITPHQTLVTINAAQLLRGDGSGTGTERTLSASDRTERVRLGFSFSFNGFAATWTIFQDTRIVPFRSCCAIFAGVLRHISLS